MSFFLENPAEFRLEECESESCAAGNWSTCAAGHTGPMCSRCLAGGKRLFPDYYKDSDGHCQPCEDVWADTATKIAITVGLRDASAASCRMPEVSGGDYIG